MKIGSVRYHDQVGMLRGFVKMGEKERNDSEPTDSQESEEVTYDSPDNSYALIHCVEEFFKNPQQNYEVPLQLLQEWFSDTSLSRRQELAKLFLTILQEQGLDMEQILNSVPDSIGNNKTNTAFIEDSSSEMQTGYVLVDQNNQPAAVNCNGDNVETRDASCGEEEAIGTDWAEDENQLSPEVRVMPAVVRQYKRQSNVYLPAKMATNRPLPHIQPPNENVQMMLSVINDGVVNPPSCFESASPEEEYATISIPEDDESDKLARPVSTRRTLQKSSSTSNLTNIKEKKCLRKSQSLPSIKYATYAQPTAEIPPLTLIEAPSSKIEVDHPRHFVEYVQPANKTSVISRTVSQTSYKARTTFVEMSQAEFVRRQTLLNERVNVRPSFRIGGQILYVPELVSCSTPVVEKSAPPLLVHSEAKKLKNPMEIKLALMGNDVMENVVVSQNSSSHTIHYTPTHSHAAPATQLINDKCSVVYVADSVPNQPVLVTAPTWQEEARKKPIIAYAKRKPAEKVAMADNMKVLVAQNGINSVDAQQQTKVITQCRPESSKQPVISQTRNISTTQEDVVFLKRVEEKRSPVVVVQTEVAQPVPPPKPTLPKFNQTFVQNLQVKTARAAEPIADSQPLDYTRKVKKPYSPVNDIAVESTSDVGTVLVQPPAAAPENPAVTHIQNHTPGVIHALPSAATPVVVERPTIAKQLPNAPPQQVGLLIYTQNSQEESNPVQTLLLTTLPNGSAYCVRLPPNTNIQNVTNSAVSSQIDAIHRPVVVQALHHSNPVSVKTVVKRPESIPPTPPPAESNKVSLLQDLKEFENVFEETKLKFEKEKQLTVSDGGEIMVPAVSVETAVQTTPMQLQITPPIVTIPKFDCDKVVVGVKRKPEDIPVVTRLFTTAKKPLIVVTNYGQVPTQVQSRPVVTHMCNNSQPVISHLKTSKPKPRSGKTFPNPAKSPPQAKPQQKPQEDEKTQQKIFAILEEYAVQKEHSPDTNNRPAPRRRSNPPTGTASKKKRPLLKTKDTSGESDEGSFSEM